MDAKAPLVTIVSHLEEAHRIAAERERPFLVYLVGMALSQARRESYEATEEPELARPVSERNGSELGAFAT